ncbi:gliding motility-associated C-terminal domain-containing protein [Chryseobacterium sp. GMJ5]|uniref:Gliding motility-associated C-terminal domain-containing protein n=1 Tax=Chryseobacterium gilvum TaxID=2976534 RepID=A0ABT2VXC2_9FLAO|nr:gliding motility-associated C-terminal domain-containing protein [Chryseobacterium gilvum]MCU7614288.1 gliding motility-associated C-terminal domain-containing protein [Chryseobacterium gilvum]
MKKLLLFFILITSQLYFSQSDCVSAIPVCGNSNISYTPSGPGTVLEDLGGCLTDDENFSVWYTFTAATSGTLAFTIDANNNTTDYDFAVYAPNATCAALGPPIRCNFAGAAPNGNTGLELVPSGSAYFVPYLDVVAGQTYYLVIDNYSNAQNSGFSLNWEGTASLTSPFTDPALTPHPFITPGVPAAIPTNPNEILKCALPMQFDFTTLSAGILNGNVNFTVTYHNTANDAITGNSPLTVATVDGTTIYYYRLKYQDPANPNNPVNGCFLTGKFKFKQGNIVANDKTLIACNNNGAGTGTFDLTSAIVFGDPTAIKKYYPTLNDLNAGTNEITNPTAYVSAPKTIYVKVTSVEGCTDDATITLTFYPTVTVTPATLQSCFIESNVTTAAFNLTTANVTPLSAGIVKKYYTTMANAVAGTNEIGNPSIFITTSTDVYVRVTDANGCYAITTITLKVLPPVKSAILKDKTICIEDRTTLDAGPGFDGYEWSTGATTQSIQGVGVGAYWVKLKTGPCFTLQQVNVFATQQPVITSVDITNNTITVNANAGTAPYQYSLNGTTWQDSNVFTNLPRGENTIFVKDAFDCNPESVQVTVPNLLNAITPNGDNVNDEIDYSALAYKKNLVFIVYDRYGNKLYEADKIRDYKWNGTSGGKKILTGTYWYTITWTENDKTQTQTKYNGWVLVKNRE